MLLCGLYHISVDIVVVVTAAAAMRFTVSRRFLLWLFVVGVDDYGGAAVVLVDIGI